MSQFYKIAKDFFSTSFFSIVINSFIIVGGIINLFLLNPEINSIFFISGIILFFISIYFITKIKYKFSEKQIRKIIYIIFLILITFMNLSGGINTAYKFLIYFFIIYLLIIKKIKESLFCFISFYFMILKQIKNFTLEEYLFFIVFLFFLFITKKFLYISTDQEGKKVFINLENITNMKINKLKDLIYLLLYNIIKIYHTILNANSILLFIRDKNDGFFKLVTWVSKEEINEDYVFSFKDAFLGNLAQKPEIFSITTQDIFIPYYKKDIKIVQKILSCPLIINELQIEGVVFVDFLNDKPEGEIKIHLKSLITNIINIIKGIDISNKLAKQEFQTEKLYEILDKLNIIEGKEELLKKFFEEIKSFDIYSGYMAEYIVKEKKFKIFKYFNYPLNIEGSEFNFAHDEIIKYIFESKKSMIVRDVNKKNIYWNFENKNIDKFFVSLLENKNNIYGLIKLDKLAGKDFSEFEIKTLNLIINKITTLFENTLLYEKIKRQAIEDGLTGLLNHLTFMERLRESVEKVNRKEISVVSLILMDIDFFKRFNDEFGHQEGDNVLKKIAEMLKFFERKYKKTYSARYGGEEFVFVLEDYSLNKTIEIAEEIRKYSATNLKGGYGEKKRIITLSLGVSIYPHGANNIRELIKIADERLYKAKESGRNKVYAE